MKSPDYMPPPLSTTLPSGNSKINNKAAAAADRRKKKVSSFTLTCPTLTLLIFGTASVTTIILLSTLPWFVALQNHSTFSTMGQNCALLASSRSHFLEFDRHHRNVPTGTNAAAATTTHSSNNNNNNNNNNKKSTVNKHDLPKILAIYFPQFHPDPLNDRLWGVNFTDWTSLRAAPTRNRYNQPLPHPLKKYGGYYDLRDTSVRRGQAEMAKKYDVDGFVIHHYWFYDPTHLGPNLHAPVEAMLNDQQPNRPFLFNWCAAPWSSLWTGQAVGQTKKATMNNPVVLQRQYWPSHNLTQIRQHYDWLRQFWILPNYIRVGDHPVLMMYQYFPESFPILRQFRSWAQQDPALGGLTIWMSRSATHPDLIDISKLKDNEKRIWKRKSQQMEILLPVSDDEGPVWNNTVAYPYMHDWSSQGLHIPGWCRRPSASSTTTTTPIWAPPEIPGIITSFDNTPRRQADQAKIWNSPDQSPDQVIEQFRQSLYATVYYETCCRRLAVYAPTQRFVIINAWNEWAEGMAMEPSTVFGTGFLEAIRNVKADLIRQGCHHTQYAMNR
jgi:hypothetical protein